MEKGQKFVWILSICFGSKAIVVVVFTQYGSGNRREFCSPSQTFGEAWWFSLAEEKNEQAGFYSNILLI